MDGSCEYIEYADVNSRKWMVLPTCGVGRRANNSHHKNQLLTKYYKGSQAWDQWQALVNTVLKPPV
jgi:hypothetical protein